MNLSKRLKSWGSILLFVFSSVCAFGQPKYRPLPEPFFEYGHNLDNIDFEGNAAVIVVFKDNNHLNFTFPHNNIELAKHYSSVIHEALNETPISPVVYLSYAELVNSESLNESVSLMNKEKVKNLIFFEIAEVHGYEFHYFKLTEFNGDSSFYDQTQYCYTIHNDNMEHLVKRLHHDILNHSEKDAVNKAGEMNFVVLDENIGILSDEPPVDWKKSTLLFAKFQEAIIPEQKPKGVQKSYYKTLSLHNESVEHDNIMLSQALANTSFDHLLVDRETWRITEKDQENIYFIDYYVDRTSFGLNKDTTNSTSVYTKASTNINFVLFDPRTNNAYRLGSKKIKGDVLKEYITFIQKLDNPHIDNKKITLNKVD